MIAAAWGLLLQFCGWKTIQVLIVAAGLTACATQSRLPEPKEPPSVTPSPLEVPFEILSGSPRGVSAFMGKNGRVQVLAMAQSRDVYHLVVGPKGVEKQELILQSASGSNLAVTFDADDQLHAVIGEQHMVLRSDAWSSTSPGPPCGSLVRVGKTLVCAFLDVHGPSGDSRRIDYYSTYLTLGLPIPIPVRNRKVWLACQSSGGWLTWGVVDPNAKRDIDEFQIAASNKGTLRVLYTWTREMMATLAELDLATGPAVSDCETLTRQDPLKALNGKLVLASGMNGPYYRFDIATDPVSGDSLVIGVFVQGSEVKTLLAPADSTEVVDRQVLPNPPALSKGHVRIAPAGDNRFHVLVHADKGRWLYLAEVDGAWTRPIELGRGSEEVAQIVAAGSSRALAIFPGDHKLMAEWIELASVPAN
jgi:hypothetical protein